jgi:heat shock protein HspQ
MARVTEDVLFGVGHIVHHVRYGYRGVVVGYDTTCQADNDWYTFQIQGKGYKPTRQQPWYHVLVDDSTGQTYVAQQNLEPGDASQLINHPKVFHFFASFHDGRYHEPSCN